MKRAPSIASERDKRVLATSWARCQDILDRLRDATVGPPGDVLALIRRLGDQAQGVLARALRDVATLVEQAAAGDEPPPPDVLAARLRDQLGREPSRDELLTLLALIEGLTSALTLTEPPTVRQALTSYADGLCRTLQSSP